MIHLGDPALAHWLGLGAFDGRALGLAALDATALGVLGESVDAHSFASLRGGVTLRWQPVDPDAAPIGAALWRRG